MLLKVSNLPRYAMLQSHRDVIEIYFPPLDFGTVRRKLCRTLQRGHPVDCVQRYSGTFLDQVEVATLCLPI